jgi:hypothetical protein
MKKAFAISFLVSCLAFAAYAEGVSAGALGFFGSIESTPSYWIGAAYQISDSIAIKPAIGFSRTTYEDDSYVSGFGIKADGLFRIASLQAVDFSVGARVGYASTKTAADSDNYTRDSYLELGPVANLQYNFSPSFGVFLDAAVLFDFNTTKVKATVGGTSTSDSTNNTTVSTQTSLGLIFYIK